MARCKNCCKTHSGSLSRCEDCLPKRVRKDWLARKEIAEALFPPAERARLLELLRSGCRFAEACEEVDVSMNRARGFSAYDPKWGTALDAALWEGRDPNLDHGTEGAWRAGCRCPKCRAYRRKRGYWTR